MNVFIVDDEFLQRELVKKIIDWEILGMDVTGEAEDGEEALQKALELKPDIMIMDINIPYLNGLEVSQRVKEVLPDTQVIILTAYGEFEYAKQALELGAVSFVLKPVDPKALTAELEKCRNKLEEILEQRESMKKMQEEISQIQKEQFLLEQLSGLASAGNEEQIRRILGIEPGTFFAMLLLRFPDKEEGKTWITEIEEMVQDYFRRYERLEINRDYIFIMFEEGTANGTAELFSGEGLPGRKEKTGYQLQMLCAYLQEGMNRDGQFYGGTSNVHEQISELREAYREAYSASSRGSRRSKINVFEPVNLEAFLHSVSYDMEELLVYLRKKEHALFLSTVQAWFEELERKQALPSAAYYVAVDILVHFSLYMTEMGIDFSVMTESEQRILSRIQDNGRAEEMAEALMPLLQKGLNQIERYKIPSTKRKVQDARAFIDRNYHRFDLSLNLVADAIGVNASYLSNIFKKEHGSSLSKYITSVRLEQARKWIQEYPEKTLIEISEATGYADVYYFSKSFKAQYGITPSRYQEERK